MVCVLNTSKGSKWFFHVEREEVEEGPILDVTRNNLGNLALSDYPLRLTIDPSLTLLFHYRRVPFSKLSFLSLTSSSQRYTTCFIVRIFIARIICCAFLLVYSRSEQLQNHSTTFKIFRNKNKCKKLVFKLILRSRINASIFPSQCPSHPTIPQF